MDTLRIFSMCASYCRIRKGASPGRLEVLNVCRCFGCHRARWLKKCLYIVYICLSLFLFYRFYFLFVFKSEASRATTGVSRDAVSLWAMYEPGDAALHEFPAGQGRRHGTSWCFMSYQAPKRLWIYDIWMLVLWISVNTYVGNQTMSFIWYRYRIGLVLENSQSRGSSMFRHFPCVRSHTLFVSPICCVYRCLAETADWTHL